MIDEAVALDADRALSRTYLRGHASLNLLIAWYRSQRDADRQPHSPLACLPGSGWTAASTGHVAIATPDGAVTVKHDTFENRGTRAVMLYWYQTPRRVVAGEWGLARYWMVLDAIRDRRTDTAQVRVFVPFNGDGEPEAQTQAVDFARNLYPESCRRLR